MRSIMNGYKQDPLVEVLQKIRERKSVKPDEAAKALTQYTKVQEHIKELKAEIEIFKKSKGQTNSGKQTNTQSPRKIGQQPTNKTVNQSSPQRNSSPQGKSMIRIVNGPKHPSDARSNGGIKQPSPAVRPSPRIVNAPKPPSEGSASPRSVKANSTLTSLEEGGYSYRASERRRSSVVSKTFTENGRDFSEQTKDKEIARLRLQNAQLKVLVEKRNIPSDISKTSADTSTLATVLEQRDIPKPEKLVQQFKQLFEQEWKNAYYELDKHHKLPEDSITELLGVVAKEAYNFCQNIAKQQFDDISAAHSHVTDVLVQPKYISLSNKDVYNAKSKNIIDKDGCKVTRRFLKDYRRVMAKTPLPGLVEIFGEMLQRDILAKYAPFRIAPKLLKNYMHRLVVQNWYMILSDPPLFQVWLRKGQLMSREHFTCYSGKKGATVVHTVWPALLTDKDGLLEEKGFVNTK